MGFVLDKTYFLLVLAFAVLAFAVLACCSHKCLKNF